ncbi:MAG TPA: ATP-binding protein [Gemmatimonadaceae bacterium]|nr:ATP-binding protein [Gemmatimonadaceae bacterium]
MRLSLGQKIIAGLGAALFILSAIDFVSYRSARQSIRIAEQAGRARAVVRAVDQTRAQLERAVIEHRGYLITNDTAYLRRFRMAVDSTSVTLTRLGQLTRESPEQSARVESVTRAITERFALLGRTVTIRQEEGAAAAARSVVVSGPDFLERTRAMLATIQDDERQRFMRWSAETERRAQMAMRVIALGAVLALALAAVAAAAIVRDLRQQRRAQAMMHFLSDASQALASSLDVDTTLSTVARLAVQELADFSLVDLLREGGMIERTAVAAADPADTPWLEIMRQHPPDAEHETNPAMQAIRSRSAVYVPRLDDERMRAIASTPEHLDALRFLGPASVLSVPLIARGAILGVLTFSRRAAQPWSREERALAEQIASRAALAVDNARLFHAAQRARADAEAANRAKTEFLATMSHELRTPLNAIAGYTELLRLGIRGPITPAQEEDLVRIRRNQEHLLSLINDVLSFAKTEVGRLELDIATFPVQEMLDEVTDTVAPQAHAKQVTYTRVVGDPGLLVRADRQKLRQVVLNLASNAVKFTHAGGVVTVSARANADDVVIAVHDTGPGIAAEHQDRIFEPFVQLDPGLTRTAEGTGLGLAIARDLVRAMGGEITVHSVVGEGTTFSVRLDAAPDRR